MSDIKVSVIVPCYNVELYLRECLDSLINQTLQEIEILVVENNSTDGTKAIIEEYAEKYPDKIIALCQSVQGVSAARNMGLEYASGKYIGFVDGDDSVSLEMLEKLYITAEKNKSDLIVFGWISVQINGVFEKYIEYYQTSINKSTNIFKTSEILFEVAPLICNKFYKKTVIKNHGLIFDCKIGYAEDMLFTCMYLLYADNIYQLRESLYLYKIRNNAATMTFNSNVLTTILACERLTEFYIEHGYFDLFREQLLYIAIGLFSRKIKSSAFKIKDRALAIEYINCFYNFFNHYYIQEDWKKVLRQYGTNGSKLKNMINFCLTSKGLLTAIIYMPNWLKKLMFSIFKLIM